MFFIVVRLVATTGPEAAVRGSSLIEKAMWQAPKNNLCIVTPFRPETRERLEQMM